MANYRQIHTQKIARHSRALLLYSKEKNEQDGSTGTEIQEYRKQDHKRT